MESFLWGGRVGTLPRIRANMLGLGWWVGGFGGNCPGRAGALPRSREIFRGWEVGVGVSMGNSHRWVGEWALSHVVAKYFVVGRAGRGFEENLAWPSGRSPTQARNISGFGDCVLRNNFLGWVGALLRFRDTFLGLAGCVFEKTFLIRRGSRPPKQSIYISGDVPAETTHPTPEMFRGDAHSRNCPCGGVFP